jgi:hypothetical protein
MESIRADRRKLSRKLSCNRPPLNGSTMDGFVRDSDTYRPLDRVWGSRLGIVPGRGRTAVWPGIRRGSGDGAGAQGRDIVRRNPAPDRFGSEFVREGLKPAMPENASKQNTSKQKMTASILFRSEPGSNLLFCRVFFTRTGIHFARKRSSKSLPRTREHGAQAAGCWF